MKTSDSNGNSVTIGDRIKILEIDEKITKFLPQKEKAELSEYVGKIFTVTLVNSDGSMVVSAMRRNEDSEEIFGNEIAIFPKGALLS
ncbi:hypothetical protein P886_1163 [Alteromonadaceae bacterium 2753L.S.0a.02]|nr:hypothetical protein P886_1163 [Alteromonadaceae bacterium 2753L.S.0a.02]